MFDLFMRLYSQAIMGVHSRVRHHAEDGWSPKTEAGTRIVPMHSKLIEAGVLALKDNIKSGYLVPGLDNSRQKE